MQLIDVKMASRYSHADRDAECQPERAVQNVPAVDFAAEPRPPGSLADLGDWFNGRLVRGCEGLLPLLAGLTVTTDKQPALARIVSRVRNETRLRYVHGFWYRGRLLAYQLLWAVNPAADTLPSRPVFRGAPTWSWMSVDGEVV